MATWLGTGGVWEIHQELMQVWISRVWTRRDGWDRGREIISPQDIRVEVSLIEAKDSCPGQWKVRREYDPSFSNFGENQELSYQSNVYC